MQARIMSRAELAQDLRKPAHGAPCNSCGLCCKVGLCDLGAEVFGREHGPCPALERGEGKAYRCGLVANPATYKAGATKEHSAAAALLIFAGFGCNTHVVNEGPKDYRFMRRLESHRREISALAARALALWRHT